MKNVFTFSFPKTCIVNEYASPGVYPSSIKIWGSVIELKRIEVLVSVVSDGKNDVQEFKSWDEKGRKIEKKNTVIVKYDTILSKVN